MLVLIGHKGVGKTTLGEYLHQHHQQRWLDSDHVLLRASPHSSITDLYRSQGEAAFREQEAQVILELLSQQVDILTLGAGAVLSPQVVSALKTVQCIQLYLPAHQLHQRWQKLQLFPDFLTFSDGFDKFYEAFVLRDQQYHRLAANVMDVSELTIAMQAATVLKYV